MFGYDIDELHEDMLFGEDVDIFGNPVERSREKFPYSYDPVVIFKLACFKKEDTSHYSDRIDGTYFTCEERDKALKKIGKKQFGDESERFSWRNPCDVERYLSILMEKNVKVTAITEGANPTTGNLYWIVYIHNAD